MRLFYADLDGNGDIIGNTVREFGIDLSGVQLVFDSPTDPDMVSGHAISKVNESHLRVNPFDNKSLGDSCNGKAKHKNEESMGRCRCGLAA